MTQSHRTKRPTNLVARIAEAGLAGDRQRLELLVLDAIRSMKRDDPETSSELGAMLSQFAANPGSLRWAETGPPPTDRDEGLALVRSERVENAPKPFMPPLLDDAVQQFVRERQRSQELVSEGFAPPSSILLIGPPGTGKTMLAKWLASELKLPLLVQDLATSVSSFLGKTGLNLRRSFDYARAKPCLLLLDEFDAIAKRRDDSTEVGELKRIVNVLLKELEEWPLGSVLVAATNHPELLDPAIERRFNVVLHLPLPGEAERLALLEKTCGRFVDRLSQKLLAAAAHVLEGSSGSDIDTLMKAAVRRHLVGDEPLPKCVLEELHRRGGKRFDGKNVGALIRAFQNNSSDGFTVRELAELFGRSVSTIQHHLTKEDGNA